MYDESMEDEATITVIATGLDAHGANTPVERAMKDFVKPKMQTAAPKTAPAAPKAAPAEAAATTTPQLNIPNAGGAQVYRPAQRETQINIPDFLKNRR